MPLAVRHDKHRGFFVEGLAEVPCATCADALSFMHKALTTRHIRSGCCDDNLYPRANTCLVCYMLSQHHSSAACHANIQSSAISPANIIYLLPATPASDICSQHSQKPSEATWFNHFWEAYWCFTMSCGLCGVANKFMLSSSESQTMAWPRRAFQHPSCKVTTVRNSPSRSIGITTGSNSLYVCAECECTSDVAGRTG